MTPVCEVQRGFLIDRHQRTIFRSARIRALEASSATGCFVSRREFVNGRGGARRLLASADLRRPDGITISHHILPLADDEGMEAIITVGGMATLPETIVMGLIGGPLGNLMSSGNPISDAVTITSCEQNDVRLRVNTLADPVRWLDQVD